METKKWAVLIVMIVMVATVFLLANNAKETKEYITPPEDVITGSIVYDEPLTLEQLKKGINLSGGWNAFRWTDELSGPISAQEALKSLADNYFYIYDYSSKKFFFNPYQKLADYKDQRYYKDRTFDKLEPGKKYAIYMVKDKVQLQYEVPEPEGEIEELKEEKGLLNNVWFWIILIIIILLLYKKKIWKLK